MCDRLFLYQLGKETQHTHRTNVLIPQAQKDFGRPDETTSVFSNSFPYISQAKGVLFLSTQNYFPMYKLKFISRVSQYIVLSCLLTTFAAANYHGSSEVNRATLICIIHQFFTEP